MRRLDIAVPAAVILSTALAVPALAVPDVAVPDVAVPDDTESPL
ncbi:hypothetical protein [Streptomyces sp. NPDC058476]